MRLLVTVALATILLPAGVFAQQQLQPLTPPGATKVGDASSYGIGYDIGSNMAAGGLSAQDIVQADFLAGLLDALSKKEPAVGQDAIRAAMEALGKRVLDRKAKIANDFLAANKKKEGVQVTESGLQYKVIKSGSGAQPTAENTVVVHYEGRFTNGEVFDSSLARGEPTSFPVTRVIPGWTEALMRMKVGDKWQLYIPPALAYGEAGEPRGGIGPNEALVFDVELLEVK